MMSEKEIREWIATLIQHEGWHKPGQVKLGYELDRQILEKVLEGPPRYSVEELRILNYHLHDKRPTHAALPVQDFLDKLDGKSKEKTDKVRKILAEAKK